MILRLNRKKYIEYFWNIQNPLCHHLHQKISSHVELNTIKLFNIQTTQNILLT